MNLNATILGQAIAFILFVLFCMKYVWPPLITTIEKRQKEINENLAYVNQAKKDLNNLQAEAANHLKQAKATAQVMIEQANKRKEEVINEAKIQAQIEYKKIMKQVQTEIDVERKRAREELRKQIATLILAGVEKIIERSISNDTNRDIIDQVINKL